MADEKSGTETAAAETGAGAAEQKPEQEAAAEQAATDTGAEQSGEEGHEPTAEEQKAAEEAAEREKQARENRKGSPEWFQRKIAREADRRRAAEAEVAKEREARIRAEEREKVLREMGATAKGGEKTAPGNLDPNDPRPKMPRMKDFENTEDYETAVDKFQDDHAAWSYREADRKSKAEREAKEKTGTDEGKAKKEREAAQAFHSKMDEVLDNVADEFGDDVVKTMLNDAKLVIPIGSPVQKLIFKSEHGGKILHHLYKNNEVLQKLLSLDDEEQYTELRRLEKQVSTPPARVPGAPAPARPGIGSANPKVDETRLSDADWFKRKQKEKMNSA